MPETIRLANTFPELTDLLLVFWILINGLAVDYRIKYRNFVYLVGSNGHNIVAYDREISQLANFDRTPDVILMVLPSAVNGVRTDCLFHGDTLVRTDDFPRRLICS